MTYPIKLILTRACLLTVTSLATFGCVRNTHFKADEIVAKLDNEIKNEVIIQDKSNYLNQDFVKKNTENKIYNFKNTQEYNYFALIIGNNNYKHMNNLNTARNDALSVAKILKDRYGFKVKIITNATRYELLSSLDEIRSRLTDKDNLLIYYAGHGYFDKEAERGYWLPVDADKTTSANWVSNADITDKIRTIHSKHILIVADSCYSGSLTRGIGLNALPSSDFEQSIDKRSRTVLTSGGLEPVNDGHGKHSVFAKAFISALNESQNIFDGADLFSKIRRPVLLNANQTPQYGDIRMANHEGGDFLFIPK